MDIALLTVDILLSLASGVLITSTCIIFLHCYCDMAFQWSKKKLVFLIIYNAAVFALDWMLLDVSWYIFAGGPLAYGIELLIVFYDFKGKRFRGILQYTWVSFVIYFSTMLITDIGSVYLFPNYDVYDFNITIAQMLITSGLLVAIFGLIFFYLYYKIYKKGIFLSFRKREKIFAIAYSLLCTVFYVVIAYYGKSSKAALVGLGISFVLAAVLIPVFFYYLQISKHYQELTKYQEVHIEAELEHFQQYQQAQEETSRFRHDIRNNLLCVSDMLQQGRTEEAEQYLKDLLKITDKSTKGYVTGDEMLESIIGVKARVMEQNNIRFSLDGVLAGGLPWKPMDICNVFANALDNAIEACQKVAPEKRHISMNIKSTPQFWMVSIENAVAEAVDTSKLFQKNGGYTSKSNADRHGIGTYNMKHTVESYGSMLKAECTDEVFKLEIMIDKSSPE